MRLYKKVILVLSIVICLAVYCQDDVKIIVEVAKANAKISKELEIYEKAKSRHYEVIEKGLSELKKSNNSELRSQLIESANFYLLNSTDEAFLELIHQIYRQDPKSFEKKVKSLSSDLRSLYQEHIYSRSEDGAVDSK